MNMDHYILIDKVPKKVPLLEWGKWLETADRTVAKTTIGDAEVSTVFLMIDHNYMTGGVPLLFETMIFGGPHDKDIRRCSTWEQAEVQHKEVCDMLNGDNVIILNTG